MNIRKYRTTYAIVLVLAMIIGTNTAFGETIGSCHKREKMLCKKRDITSLWKELSDELSELKEEMVNIKETVNGLKKDELGELKQEILDIKETVNDLKKGELGELKEEMVDTKETLNELKKDILGTKNQIRVGPHMDCSEDKNFTGARIIQPHGQKAFRVYCSGGCVYIARRFDGSVDFYRGWAEYQRGFGSPGGEYFIGLDNLHGLLNQSKYSLTVELTTWPPQSETRHAKYSVFDVSDESDNYRLTIGSYSGTAGNSLSWHTGMAFTTKDRDNDKFGSNCALSFTGAWWYKYCHISNLFGFYGTNAKCGSRCMIWREWPNQIGSPHNDHYSFKKMNMKVCPK